MTTGRRIALLDEARGAFERGDLAAAESACREIVTRDKRNVNARPMHKAAKKKGRKNTR